MEAKALTPRDLFDGKVCYEIPPFQRPYVWTEEDQWQPLWDDIARVAEAVLVAGEEMDGLSGLSGHFLGAVVRLTAPGLQKVDGRELILGLCGPTYYDRQKAVIWTNNRLSRRLDLFQPGRWYADN